MNKTKYEVVNGITNTVGELIELLKKVPSNYTVSLSGMNTFGVLMDTENETALLDDMHYIEEISDETKINNSIDSVYAVIGYSDVFQCGSTEAVLQGVFSTEELARECGDELVESGNIEYYEIECPKLDEFGWK